MVRRGGRSRRWLRNRYISTYVDSPNRNVPAETLNADTKCHAYAPGTRMADVDSATVQIASCGGKITIRQVGNVSLPSAITSILWNRRVVPNYLANGDRNPCFIKVASKRTCSVRKKCTIKHVRAPNVRAAR